MNSQVTEALERMLALASHSGSPVIAAGRAEGLAHDLQREMSFIRSAFHAAGYGAELSTIDGQLAELRRPRSDKDDVLSRLHSMLYGLKMASKSHPE